MIKRQDYNVMNTKEPEMPLEIKDAYVNENGFLVLVNEGNAISMPTSIEELTNALEKLDSKFFTDEFANSLRDLSIKKAVKSRSDFISKSTNDELKLANKNLELIEQAKHADLIIGNKQQEREKQLNKKEILAFVSALNGASKTASMQDNAKTQE